MSTDLALAIRVLRLAQGISQEALSVRAKVTRASINRYERGVYEPSLHVLPRLARSLGVSVWAFLRFAELLAPRPGRNQEYSDPTMRPGSTPTQTSSVDSDQPR